jgi:hypothetical protein
MTASNIGVTKTFIAGEALGSYKYCLMVGNGTDLTVTHTTSSISALAVGVLQDWGLARDPVTGDAVTLVISGPSKVWLGATLTEGAIVGPEQATGQAIAVAAGHYPFGRITQGGADNEIGEMIVNISPVAKA